MVLQATCDYELRITDAYTGWPGSVHDARVLKNSELFQKLQDNPESVCPGGSCLIGDAAYPLSETMITPFRRTGVPFTAEQTNFNFKHSSTRMCIERTFGILKGRFRRLKFINVRKVDQACKIIIVACILHNICLADRDLDEFMQEDEDIVPDFRPLYPDVVNGIAKRRAIVADLMAI